MKVFHNKEGAKAYADKNYFKGDSHIEETRNGNFRIIKNETFTSISFSNKLITE